MKTFMRIFRMAFSGLFLWSMVYGDPGGLTGQWQARDSEGESFRVVFQSDGTGKLDAEPFTYKMDGNILTLNTGEGAQLILTCQRQGNGWVLAMGDVYSIKLSPLSGQTPGTGRALSQGAANENRKDGPSSSVSGQPGSRAVVSSLAGSGIRFVREEGNGQFGWVQINPQTSQVSLIRSFPDTYICSPAISGDGSVVIFAVRHPRQPHLIGEVNGQRFDLAFPPDQDMQVRHPTMSRDCKLLAFTIRSSKHVGNVDVHDWNTGAYDHTYMAVGTWYKVVSINLNTGKQQAVYHDDDLVPDVMKKRGLGPVFSPVEDILVYADNLRIYVCDSYSGRNLRTFQAPTGSTGGWTGTMEVSEYSGLAFSPDGKMIAYLSQGQADIAISPDLIVLMDVRTGNSRFIRLPRQSNLSGCARHGLIYLDFSLDGRQLVFSASVMNQQREIVGPFLCVVDLQTGSVSALDAAGTGASDPVWKGR
ncbi:PD40 domain-containing protein [bacterium]|nr:PD40 domain-containing protein [bacterium]